MIKFYLDSSHPNKAGECSIRASFATNEGQFLTTIGHSVSPALWNGATVLQGTQKNPVRNAKGVLATEINAFIARITLAYNDLEESGLEITKEDCKALVRSMSGQQAPAASASEGRKARAAAAPSAAPAAQRRIKQPSVLECFDNFVNEEGAREQWADATYRSWRTFRAQLQAFKAKLSFDDFNEAGITEYIDYLRTRVSSEIKREKAQAAHDQAEKGLAVAQTGTERQRAKAMLETANKALASMQPEGLNEKSAEKRYKELRWFLTWAIRKGVCNEKAIENYKAKFKIVKKQIIFLTAAELQKLREFEIPANGTIVELTDGRGRKYKKTVCEAGALAKTRDLFCFCAYTSLRYSDMAQLRRIDIYKDALHVVTEKTDTLLEIPLNNHSREILAKYEGQPFPGGLALPVIANQRMNYYLKDLCELCGFNGLITTSEYRNGNGKRIDETFEKWQLMTTHAARRTFICNALTKGMTPNMVMKFTGHSDYDAMKPYIDIAADDAVKAMQLLNN